MDWYIVVKTIKGHRYRYRQRTWREGGKVRTQSECLGREDAFGAERTPRQKKAAAPSSPGAGVANETAEAALIDTLFDPAKADEAGGLPWPMRYNAKGRRFSPDPRLLKLVTGMGITGKTRPWQGRASRWDEPDGAWYRPSDDSIQLPDHTRFVRERDFAHVLLHELTHATNRAGRSPRPENSYAEEELVAEIGANLVALRLGLGSERVGRSARYVQVWLGRCDDAARSRAFAEREARKAADYIMRMWARVTTTT